MTRGWGSRLAQFAGATLIFEAVTGLAITLSPFHPVVEWSVLLHTVVGVATLLPLAWYLASHWADYRDQAISDVVLLGYVATVALVVCAVSEPSSLRRRYSAFAPVRYGAMSTLAPPS